LHNLIRKIANNLAGQRALSLVPQSTGETAVRRRQSGMLAFPYRLQPFPRRL